jgi:hypothetical protein
MKHPLITLLLAAAAVPVRAQTVTPVVLSNDGGYTQTAGGSIEWTLGEPVSETMTFSTNITTMGFHQPELSVVAMLAERERAGGLLVFPNPVRDELKVSFSGLEAGSYVIRLTDAIGKIIMDTKVEVSDNDRQLIIRMSEVAAGNYFLNVRRNALNETIQVTKVY